jgi:hypothetical protein
LNIKPNEKYKKSNQKAEPLIATTTDFGNCLMESWFCIWDDLANTDNGLNLVPNPL